MNMYMNKKMNAFICYQSVYNVQVGSFVISAQHKELEINETIFIFALQDDSGRKKPNYYWTDQTMDQAVSAVLKDGMSVNKASKIFNVPRKILTERVGGRVRAIEEVYSKTRLQQSAWDRIFCFS